VVVMAGPPVAPPVYQQNAQAAKTAPVATSRLRTIKANFMVRLRWEAKSKPSRPYVPAATPGYDDRVLAIPAAIGRCASQQNRAPIDRFGSTAGITAAHHWRPVMFNEQT
jgi:hypothetical protein